MLTKKTKRTLLLLAGLVAIGYVVKRKGGAVAGLGAFPGLRAGMPPGVMLPMRPSTPTKGFRRGGVVLPAQPKSPFATMLMRRAQTSATTGQRGSWEASPALAGLGTCRTIENA